MKVHFSFLLFIFIATDIFADMKRLDYANIVIDYRTGLLWQDDNSCLSAIKEIKEAKLNCAKLSLSGISDGWRIPTRKELSTIVDSKKSKPSIKSPFVNCANANYLSTNTMQNSGTFWVIDFNYGTEGMTVSNMPVYLRCVRGN